MPRIRSIKPDAPQHRKVGPLSDRARVRGPRAAARRMSPDPDTLTAALDYLARGWSVFAVPEGSKEPSRRWGHLQRRLPTATEIRADFAKEPGRPNVGAICGQVSRLVVLDTDDAEAEARLAGLDLPRTLTVRTARGRHYYFRHVGPLPSRKLAGLELRADGAYVLAPPSRHPSGLLYAFEDATAPVAELPQAVLDLFSPEAPASPRTAGPPPSTRYGAARRGRSGPARPSLPWVRDGTIGPS